MPDMLSGKGRLWNNPVLDQEILGAGGAGHEAGSSPGLATPQRLH